MSYLLIFPMAFYVFFMFCTAVLMFLSRFRAIQSGQVNLKYYKSYEGGDELPSPVIVAGRHYDNQFQVPVLFLATCGCFLALGKVDALSLVLAWSFVATRVLHSIVHLGKNNVVFRALAFFAGWFIILLMWAQLVYIAMGSAGV